MSRNMIEHEHVYENGSDHKAVDEFGDENEQGWLSWHVDEHADEHEHGYAIDHKHVHEHR